MVKKAKQVVAQNQDVEQKPQTDALRDKLDKRLSDLETQAVSLEERAKYAEKEAELRKRITDARARINAARPPSVFDGLLPSILGKLPKSMGVRAMLVIGVLVTIVLLATKACSGS